jgi:hypothetical protein
MRGLVTVVVLRAGRFRLRCIACGDKGSKVEATVNGEQLVAALAMVCGWVDAITQEKA